MQSLTFCYIYQKLFFACLFKFRFLKLIILLCECFFLLLFSSKNNIDLIYLLMENCLLSGSKLLLFHIRLCKELNLILSPKYQRGFAKQDCMQNCNQIIFYIFGTCVDPRSYIKIYFLYNA